jgi:hypothetical protein
MADSAFRQPTMSPAYITVQEDNDLRFKSIKIPMFSEIHRLNPRNARQTRNLVEKTRLNNCSKFRGIPCLLSRLLSFVIYKLNLIYHKVKNHVPQI